MAPQSSFRTIQPAVAILAEPAAPKRDKAVPRGGSSAAIDKRARRWKSVTQACNTCRRHKARCDGGRPRCGGCVSKGKQCGYEGEAGQSRQAAIKTRLEALEKLVSALQSRPQEEAQQLLLHIRSADDIVSLSGPGDDAYSIGMALDGIASGSVSCPSSASRSSNSPAATSIETHSPLSLPPNFSARDPDSLIRLIMPKGEPTRAAIRSFYVSCGDLFHAFPQGQMEEYCRGIFDQDYHIDVSQRVAICCLSSVAAVGVQYSTTAGDVSSADSGSAAVFHDVARHYFADIVEEDPLNAIKLCAMLAMYNVLAKATAGLAYVEAGMGMSQRFAVSGSSCPSLLTISQWEEFRAAWRMLLFLSGWLSSTLGYVSGNEDSTFQILVPQAGLEHDHNTPIGKIAQTEMTKISLLKARLLRSHLASKVLTSDALDSALQALQDWHESLPRALLLTNLARVDLGEQDRRTLFYTHLLYFGAIILIYRRIISQAVQNSRVGRANSKNSARDFPDGDLLSHSDKGILAAKYSSRILGLLLAECGIMKRCWLIIFQAHTSCVVILQSVAQKQLHNFPPALWLDDLEHAKLCLDTLKFCGTVDPVALNFHKFLSGIYDGLLDRGKCAKIEEDNSVKTEWASLPPDLLPLDKLDLTANPSSQPHYYLISAPSGADAGLKKLSSSLLYVVCRPWDDIAEGGLGRKMKNGVVQSGDLERAELDEGSDWEFENKSSFRWDTQGMGLGTEGGGKECCFIGSEEPSGWSPAVDVDVYDDEPDRLVVAEGRKATV